MQRSRYRRAAPALVGSILLSILPSGLLATHEATAANLQSPPAATVVTIGISVPPASKSDYVNAASVAVARANQARVLPDVIFKLRFLSDGVGSDYSPAQDAANARALIADPTVIGEVGPDNSGAAEASMPIYNRAGLLQVSPDNTLVLLTDPGELARFQPATAAGQGPRTYYRTAVNDGKQSAGAARFARTVLHVRTAYVVANNDPYGIGLAQQFSAQARSQGIRIVGSGQLSMIGPDMGARAMAATIKQQTNGQVDLVYFGGTTGAGGGAEPLLRALRASGMDHPIYMGGDGIGTSDFVSGGTPALAEGSYSTGVGYPANANVPMPRMARLLLGALHQQFPKYTPVNYDNAIFDATNVIIEATVRAVHKGTFDWQAWETHDSASLRADRAAIAQQVTTIRSYPGATGALGFDRNGDSTAHAVISVYRVEHGAWQFVQYAPGFTPLHDRFLQ